MRRAKDQPNVPDSLLKIYAIFTFATLEVEGDGYAFAQRISYPGQKLNGIAFGIAVSEPGIG